MEIRTAYGVVPLIDRDHKRRLLGRISDAMSVRNPNILSFTEELETLLNKYQK